MESKKTKTADGGSGLRAMLDMVLRAYISEFEEKHGVSREFSVAGDLMQPACIADRFLRMEDVIYDIDTGLPPGWVFDWYDACTEREWEGTPGLHRYAMERAASLKGNRT